MITRHLAPLQRRGGERGRAKLAGKRVRIWSAEHSAWWRPGGSGYTRSAAAAGVFGFEEAWGMTFHCGPEKRIVFQVVEPGAERRDPNAWPLPITAENTMRSVIRNAGTPPLPGSRARTVPRWSAVSRVTAHGSGYSAELCRWAGLDPDEQVRPRR